MPLQNSYIWYSWPGTEFLKEMQAAVLSDFMGIPDFTEDPPASVHLTLGLAVGKREISPTRILMQMRQLVNEHDAFKKRILLLPTDLFITDKGIICVEYDACPLENQGSIHAIHNAILDMAERENLEAEKYYSRTNFRPHLSIGRLPYKKQSAVDYLAENKADLLSKLCRKVRVLGVYNVQLDHYSWQRESTTLLEHTFSPMNYGVKSVIPDPANQRRSRIIFDNQEQACACLTFLYQFGKVTSETTNNACLPIQQQDRDYFFEIDNSQLSRVSGIVSNVVSLKRR